MFEFLFRFERCRRPRLVLTIGPVSEQANPKPVSGVVAFHRPHSTEVDIVFQMTDSQQSVLTLTAVDKRGNPVPAMALTGVTWSTDTPAVLKLTPDATGATCTIASVGPLGTATVTVNASLTDGTAATGSLAVTVVSGAPVSITVVPGAPTEQP